ncbi:MAG: hypothetical protein HDR35_08680 [Treponema sp.]|nr:hypothetical protein [Treponema sp.]MBD5447168.1 hypothetical protein [Treponema sp.]
MKTFKKAFCILCIGLFFVGIASAKRSKKKIEKTIQVETIDWQGKALGAQIPEWAILTAENNTTKLAALPEFKGKNIFCTTVSGVDQNFLKTQITQFDAVPAFSRLLSQSVLAKFGGALEGSDGDTEIFLKEIVATLSRTSFSGLDTSKIFWSKTRTIDKVNDTISDTYHYYLACTIDKENLKEQVGNALKKLETNSSEQERLRADVVSAMDELMLLNQN